MTQSIYIVRAWGGLSDAEIQAWIDPLQKQCDEFAADWAAFKVQQVELHYLSTPEHVPNDGWPIFINRHSSDPGALGWHTDEQGQAVPIYGRVFAGDCLKDGISVSVDLSHEVLETMGDPDASETWTMPDGRRAAREACDAVEEDELGLTYDGVLLSDYVLPAYFSTGPGPYDKAGKLLRPCPQLEPGGYMSIADKDGAWSQITADLRNGLKSARALQAGYRTLRRHTGAHSVRPVA